MAIFVIFEGCILTLYGTLIGYFDTTSDVRCTIRRTFHFMKYERVFCRPSDIPPPFFLRLPPVLQLQPVRSNSKSGVK